MNEVVMPNRLAMPGSAEMQVYERRDEPGVWATEAFGSDGECYLAKFYGPEAEDRARAYAKAQTAQ